MQLRKAPPRRAVSLTAATATVAALTLVAPATAENDASVWSQHSADAHNSFQGGAAAPADPGLRWLTDLGEVETEQAPQGYSVGSAIDRFGDLDQPVLAPDGTLVVRAENDADDADVELVGIDPDDGEIVWSIEDIRSSCGQAVDGQGRLWARTTDGELAAFDPADGSAIDGAAIEYDEPCIDVALHLGGDPEHLVVFRSGSNAQIETIDVSGDEPEESWIVELGENGPFDGVLHTSNQPRRGVVADDALYVVGITEDGDDDVAEVVALSLDDGTELDRIALPTFDGPASAFNQASLALAGDTLAVGIERARGQDGDGYLAAYDVSGALDQQWVHRIEDGRGPTALALGDGAVYANQGNGTVTAYALDDGTIRFGDVEVIELGGGVSYYAATDADGRLLTSTRAGDGTDGRAVTLLSTDGHVRWQAPRGLIRQEADLTENGLPSGSLRIGPIADDGTVYVYRGGTILAIDDSGGLAAPCELPFDDVDEELNVHAANICELVRTGITAGIDEDHYGPALSVTRAQMATFLTRTLGLTPRAGSQFEDVDDADVHAENIYALVDAGITAGVTDTTFEPQGNLTRDQMATFLARAAELDPVDGDGFDDVEEDNVHRENIYAVRDADITQGTGDRTFSPGDEVRRDQMASFLMRLVDHLDEQG